MGVRHVVKLSVLPLVLAGSLGGVEVAGRMNPLDYVDPRIGNVAPFLKPTYPTFHQPNQMLRMFPIKESYLADQVEAFPLQVTSHRRPGLFRIHLSLGPMASGEEYGPMDIDHDLEVVHPWRYETTLIEEGITVAFAPGRRAAIYRFDFPNAAQKNIVVQGTDRMAAKVEGSTVFTMVEQQDCRSPAPNTPPVIMSIFCYAEISDENGDPANGIHIQAEPGQLRIAGGAEAPDTLQLKYAISYVSAEQAHRNFLDEVAGEDCGGLSASARSAWDAVLGTIMVEGGTEAQRRTFYTALYKTHERMVDINEGGRYFSAYDHRVHTSDRPFYVDDWAWDSFRAHHPLRALLAPAQQEDMLASYVEMYLQSGWMPTFPLVNGNHPAMNGYHSSSLFLDAHRKGLGNFDLETAYEGVRKNFTEGTYIPWRQTAPATDLDDDLRRLGYLPGLHPGEPETEPLVDGFERRQSVAVTLGRCYDAWVLSEWAGESGKPGDQERFAAISGQYATLWHPDIRMFMPKDAAGEWIIVDPKSGGGQGYRDYFAENNGWTYAWSVQHDIPGLIALLGGPQAAVRRLDRLFREPLGTERNLFYVTGPDSTGMVGQFSMGNEPSFHIPYLYNYCGAPWKTQQRTRFLLDVWFNDTIFGIPGDEDGGAMSAWVVFTAMGFYPVTPGEPVYAITSPIFSKATIRLPQGRQFTVVAPGANARNKYIQKAELNGHPLNTPFITHDQIVAGGNLTLELGPTPNRSWGVE